MKPHLTPENLVGQRFGRDTFKNTKVALVGYCPPPSILKKYQPLGDEEQYFIHLNPKSVQQISYQGISILSLCHVYGGPVSASTVEELAYYGIEYILAYGLAGGLGTKNLSMGDFYLVESAEAFDGTTKHYSEQSLIFADKNLSELIIDLGQMSSISMTNVKAFTGDAIYQEHDELLNFSRTLGCDIINLDSSHLFAASLKNNEGKKIKAVECGVISDVACENSWDSNLSVMLSKNQSMKLNPLEKTGKIVEFYIEKLIPKLLLI